MSVVYQCLVVEDEPLAQQVLEKYITAHPCLELAAICSNALEAQSFLAKQPVPVVFLDVNLPRLSGISFLKSLYHPPHIIFTTAYPEYAVQGFELDAVDYLLKPFSFERFLKAVNKLLEKLDKKAEQSLSSSIFIKTGKKVFNVKLEDIRYVEALDDYVKVVTTQSQHLVNDTLKSLMEQLPATHFVRVHKSYIIAKEHIVFLEGNYVRIGEMDIPVGLSYRDELLKLTGAKKNK